MSAKKLTVDLMVDDVNATVKFYQENLGFDFQIGVPTHTKEQVTIWSENEPLDFAIMKIGDAEVMLQSRESLANDGFFGDGRAIGASAVLYIETDDVKGLYDRLKGKATIVKDIRTAHYGMEEFYVSDNNGYIIGFAQPV